MRTLGDKKIQILVVDDEPTVCRAITMLLRYDGHDVHSADSGEAALAVLEQHHFDLIITDFSMPGMKGDQLVTTIKQLWPEQAIIMATAFAEEFNTFGRPCAGLDYLLQKPFSQLELREAIAQVLAGKILNPDPGKNEVVCEKAPETLPQPPKT
jgi:CheY-like chemotaxis protein